MVGDGRTHLCEEIQAASEHRPPLIRVFQSDRDERRLGRVPNEAEQARMRSGDCAQTRITSWLTGCVEGVRLWKGRKPWEWS